MDAVIPRRKVSWTVTVEARDEFGLPDASPLYYRFQVSHRGLSVDHFNETMGFELQRAINEIKRTAIMEGCGVE